VLLKQGYMQRKTAMGWKRQYFRLLQDSLFSFTNHESKTPTDEVELMAGVVEDASWAVKKANALRIETRRGVKVLLICETSIEHKHWFDAIYYATTVSTLAEYCSPLSGGWLQHLEGQVWVRRWFVIQDSFLLCYNSREDVTPATTTGKPVNRRFVLPLGGVIVAYHKTVKPFSFSLQIYSGGELKHEFVFAADSEPIMNVWMEVLYVSTGKELPGFEEESERAALELEANLDSLSAGDTPVPCKSHQQFTDGKGQHVKRGVVDTGEYKEGKDYHLIDHQVTLPPEEPKEPKVAESSGLGGLLGGGKSSHKSPPGPAAYDDEEPQQEQAGWSFFSGQGDGDKRNSGGCTQQ